MHASLIYIPRYGPDFATLLKLPASPVAVVFIQLFKVVFVVFVVYQCLVPFLVDPKSHHSLHFDWMIAKFLSSQFADFSFFHSDIFGIMIRYFSIFWSFSIFFLSFDRFLPFFYLLIVFYLFSTFWSFLPFDRSTFWSFYLLIVLPFVILPFVILPYVILPFVILPFVGVPYKLYSAAPENDI